MRFDLPPDLPRRRQPEPTPSAPPLVPSPLDQQREEVKGQMELRRPPAIPPARRAPESPLDRLRTDTRQSVAHDHPVPRRSRRNELPQQLVGLSLRQEEVKAVGEIGRFRVIASRDLALSIYDGHHNQMARDVRFLEQQGLLRVESVNARRDGRAGKVERIEVVTLTKAGRDLARRVSGLSDDQRLYAGLVKPREVEHDTQIYRAYLKEAERIEHAGGNNLRVQLDFELKARIQKAIYAARKAEPQRDINEIKQQVARQSELPYVNNGIQIPDARIEYDLDQGSRTGHQDIEVLTAAYRPGHLRNKVQAGFHVYASASDRATLTAKIEGDHHLLDNILEL